jgi:hypothetical protein
VININRNPQFQTITNLLKDLGKVGEGVFPAISEEMQIVPTTFEIEGSIDTVWDNYKSRKSEESLKTKRFSSFIDGVQRSAIVYWITDNNLGIRIPIVMGHIAAGVTIRDENKKLRALDKYIRDRILLLFPYTGIIKSSNPNLENIIKNWIDSGFVIPETKISENLIETFEDNSKIILCDTTFNKISRTEKDEENLIQEAQDDIDNGKSTNLLIDTNLYNINKIRGRAQGRINVLRQILEMFILTKFKIDKIENKYNNENDLILVDGPLFFFGKWVKKYKLFENKRDDEREAIILKNVVGFVKTLKSRPKKIDILKQILNLEEGYYSDLLYIEDAIDISGEKEGYEKFTKPHVVTFLRFKTPRDFKPPSHLGLVRIDLHLSTFNADTFEEIKGNSENTYKTMDDIINAILNERLPGVDQIGRTFTETFPIRETEKMLHSRLYSTLEMKYLYSLIK